MLNHIQTAVPDPSTSQLAESRTTKSRRRNLLRMMIVAGLVAAPSQFACAGDLIVANDIEIQTTHTPSELDWLSVPLPVQLPPRPNAAADLRPRPLPTMDLFEADLTDKRDLFVRQPTLAAPLPSEPTSVTPEEVSVTVNEPLSRLEFDLRATDTMSAPDWLSLPLPTSSGVRSSALASSRPQRLPTFDGVEGDPFPEDFDIDCHLSSHSALIDWGASETNSTPPQRLPMVDGCATSEESSDDFIAAAGMNPIVNQFDHSYSDFSATPLPAGSQYNNPHAAQWIYDSKRAVPTQSPWIEWGRPFYGDGMTPRGIDWFGPYNMVRPQFYLYGDYRSGIAAGRNAAGRTDNWSSRLNLDMDLKVTDTERFHGFIGPLDRAGKFSGVQLNDGELDYQSIINPNFVTAFFEGDLGAIWGGFYDRTSPMELPFTVGLVPLLFQNGIWMEDAVTGAAFSLPARHSRLLNWANFDVTFFAAVDQINSAAFGTDNHAAQAFGNAWFIEAYDGYIETGYAFVRDRNNPAKSYHNMTASFTRRYFDRVSNSVRVIVNSGQDLAKDDRTADGGLLLVENSLITASPLTVVPYANFFYGWGRPQSVARAANSGGILRNTGINFDTDGLNGLATLDPTGADTAGGSIGVDLIGNRLDRQLLLEASYLTEHGDSNAGVDGDQFGLGARYQFPISNATLLRFDVMHGWRGDLPDVYGTRMEYRWKF
ncbi:hypothetical protein [Aporhodopirellula aestuarii]|uniref:Uncharacterized protein n=1 Tax=Aporhodopirellula aestuarii TaxID=2950107 RepID=A0ABT0TYF7_9BACT|nr:hypothetical protein [Aporhodopirellula aestuarii]MCM2369414.1 hypothetical protein [Aporhodopirellula aestuarii]